MSDVPSDFYDDGSAEELYKILRQSSVGKQHVIATDTALFQMYRPYCHGNLPIFTIGNHAHRNPALEGDVVAAMVEGVVEAPVEGTNIALGDTVYAAVGGAGPYLTTDISDTNIVCCWGIIIDDQRPIHYGEAVLAGDYENLYSVRMIMPTCGTLDERT